MIHYVIGDLFSTPHNVIVHGCNAQGKMGSGVARTVKKLHPWSYDIYAAQAEQGNLQLGKVLCTRNTQTDLIIAHLICQETYGRIPDFRYVSYDAIDRGLNELAETLKYESRSFISMPKIGSARGKGQWSVVEAIVSYQLKDFEVFVYSQE
jgi:O-acetyl-ADP-ribose deacetylase (regulator of RNase III)